MMTTRSMAPSAAQRYLICIPLLLVCLSCSTVYATRLAGTTAARHLMAQESAQAQLQRMFLAIPVYGSWCGPNYGSGTPIDGLDDCCRQHDLCYDSTGAGYFSRKTCSCDRNLATCASSFSPDSADMSWRRRQRSMAQDITNVFKATAAVKGC
jgi:hypothetical protein